MKYGIIVGMPDEKEKYKFTYALYEHLVHKEKIQHINFVTSGVITIDEEHPRYSNPVEIILDVQRFLEKHPEWRTDLANLKLVKIDLVGDFKPLITDDTNARKQEDNHDDDHEIDNLLSALANNYYVKYASFINNGDYTALLNKLEQDCISSDFCLYKNNDDYSARCYYLCENEKKRIAVYIESIDTIDGLSEESDRLVYKCKPVCFKVKAIHLDSDKCATRILWGEDPLIE